MTGRLPFLTAAGLGTPDQLAVEDDARARGDAPLDVEVIRPDETVAFELVDGQPVNIRRLHAQRPRAPMALTAQLHERAVR